VIRRILLRRIVRIWNRAKFALHRIPPEALHDVGFVVRDSKRFAETGGWGHVHFSYDAGPDRSHPIQASIASPACAVIGM